MKHQSLALSLTLLLLFQFWKFSDCSCNLPASLMGSWWDSRPNRAIAISSLQVTSGWEIGSYNTFTCIHSNDTHWVFKSDQLNHIFVNNFYAVLCLGYTRITDDSYYYYLHAMEASELSMERIRLTTEAEFAAFNMSDYCSTTNGPDNREYNVLVRQNTQSSVRMEQYFPDPLLGVFHYTVTNSTGTTTCSTTTVWDGCYVGGILDRTTITFNYTLCGTKIMGSDNGKFYKVAHVYHINTYYVTLINADGTDTIFSCIAVTQNGNTRSVSTNSGGCAKGQVASNYTSDSNSQLLTLTEYETCLFTTASGSSTSSSSNTGLIVGIVLALFLLIAIIIIAYLIYRKYLQPRKKQITHRTSIRTPVDGKKPLPPDSDFTLSDNPKTEKQPVEDDMVVEPLTPTGNIENPLNEALNGTVKPMPELQRAPTSFQWMKRIPEKDGPRALTPLGVPLNPNAWEAQKPLPSIHRQ